MGLVTISSLVGRLLFAPSTQHTDSLAEFAAMMADVIDSETPVVLDVSEHGVAVEDVLFDVAFARHHSLVSRMMTCAPLAMDTMEMKMLTTSAGITGQRSSPRQAPGMAAAHKIAARRFGR